MQGADDRGGSRGATWGLIWPAPELRSRWVPSRSVRLQGRPMSIAPSPGQGPAESLLLAAFVEQVYLRRRPGLKPRSRQSIQHTLRLFAEFLRRRGGEATVSDLAAPYVHVAAFLEDLVARRLRPASVNLHWRNLKALAAELDLHELVPWRRKLWPPKLKEPKHAPVAFSESEMARLLETIARQPGQLLGRRGLRGTIPVSHLLRAFVLVVYATAGRFGSVYGLRRGEVDLAAAHVLLRAETAKDGEDLLRWLTPEASSVPRTM